MACRNRRIPTRVLFDFFEVYVFAFVVVDNLFLCGFPVRFRTFVVSGMRPVPIGLFVTVLPLAAKTAGTTEDGEKQVAQEYESCNEKDEEKGEETTE